MRESETCSLSVVIPVYNSEGTLEDLVEQLVEVLEPRPAPFEIVLVNDGSVDSSWEKIRDLAAAHPTVRGANLSRNFGQHNALLAGIRLARHEVIVTMDDDLQNPPAEIPKLLEKLAEGDDVVYGRPREEKHGFVRDLASVLIKGSLTAVLGAEVARNISAFRVFRAHLRGAFAKVRLPTVSIDVLLSWGTTRFGYVYVRHDERQVGRSNYSLGKLLLHTLNMTVGFSTLPLKFAAYLGFTFTLFGMGVLMYVLIRWLIQGSVVPGFPFLAATIAIFSGAQLFALGVIGEYVGRIHSRSLDQPNYLIRESTDEDEPETPA